MSGVYALSHRVSVGRVAAAARLHTVRTTQEEAT
jgi:hypothetical protein